MVLPLLLVFETHSAWQSGGSLRMCSLAKQPPMHRFHRYLHALCDPTQGTVVPPIRQRAWAPGQRQPTCRPQSGYHAARLPGGVLGAVRSQRSTASLVTAPAGRSRTATTPDSCRSGAASPWSPSPMPPAPGRGLHGAVQLCAGAPVLSEAPVTAVRFKALH